MKQDIAGQMQRLLAAMNDHDADAIAALMAEDVSFSEPTHPEPRIGRDSLRQEMAGFFAMLPDIRFCNDNLAVSGNVALCEFSYTATYEGRPVQLRECSVSEIDDHGHFRAVRVYFDRLTLLRQLGLPAE